MRGHLRTEFSTQSQVLSNTDHNIYALKYNTAQVVTAGTDMRMRNSTTCAIRAHDLCIITLCDQECNTLLM